MSRFVLMPAAKEDIAEIRDFYLQEAGYPVAKKMMAEFLAAFRFLARTPGAGHARPDLAEHRPILFWPMGDYLILYSPGTHPLEILSVFRGSRDIPALIGRRQL